MNRILKNFVYQSIFQVAKIIMPVITIPIVSNALGPTGVGLYNYTNSIAQYFVLVAGLGVSIYGNRQVAIAYNQKGNLNQVFWEIFNLKAMMSLFSLLLYFLVLSQLGMSILFLAQSLLIIQVLVDISWLFMGVEDFKKTSMTSLLMQSVAFTLIVLFVKDENDLVFYTVVQVSSLFLGQALVWFGAKRYISFQRFPLKNSLKHLKPCLGLFIPEVAILLYTTMNKTVLGGSVGEAAVGYYTNSMQISQVFITLITTLDLVLLPYMTGMFAKNRVDKMLAMMDKTLHGQLFISIPLMFGLLTTFDKLVPWFFGEKFLFINQVIPYFSLLIVIVPLGLAFFRQYLMPMGKVKEFNISVFAGAGVNLLGTLILLPFLGFFGVVVANIAAELLVTIVRGRYFQKNTQFTFRKRNIFCYLFSGAVMCLVTRYLTATFEATVLTNLIQVSIAVPIYFFLTYLLGVNPVGELFQQFKLRKAAYPRKKEK